MIERGTYAYQVQPREVDLTKKATIFTMGDCFLHAAGEDADRNGFGIRLLHSNNMAWVLSRMCMEIYRFPDEYEEYRIETWVNEVGRLMTVRNFILKDLKGERIGAAITCWAMIDMQTRLPLDLRTNVRYADAVIADESPIEKPARIARVEGTLGHSHRIRYSDIDFNQHTNSMKYIQLMIDTLPLERITGRRFRRLDINFLHETKYGQTIDIFTEDRDTASRFEIKTDDTPVCKAAIEWF